MRLRIFSRRSGSMAARSRTNLSRVFHFAYLLQPIPIARSADMIQIVISVPVTRRIKKQNVLATTRYLSCNRLLPGARTLAAATASCDHEECMQLRWIDRKRLLIISALRRVTAEEAKFAAQQV